MPFINARTRYFAEMIAELLYWVGEDRMLFASDYALWHPKWIIDKFMDFELPDDLTQETGRPLTAEGKRKILGLNAARLYELEVPPRAAGAPAGAPGALTPKSASA
jgi:predicted TIM-barrel fold metal-dependent hydrolase